MQRVGEKTDWRTKEVVRRDAESKSSLTEFQMWLNAKSGEPSTSKVMRVEQSELLLGH